MDIQKIVQYYDECEIDYKWLWHLNSEMAMHFGFWDETTHRLREALQRQNQLMAERVRIRATDLVLDAGCGVGGSVIYLAKKYGCKVVGITLSANQVNTAKKNAQKNGVSHLVSFQVDDYMKTSFPLETFDVVWAIESICYAKPKKVFLQEAFRVLKKRGRLIVADFFATDEAYSTQGQILMGKMARGWQLESFEPITSFKKSLVECGFKNVNLEDMTLNVSKSAKRLFLMSFPFLFITKILEFVKIRSAIQTGNVLAVCYQYKALRKHLWRYGVFYAEKI